MKLAKILALTTLLVASSVQAGGYADFQYYEEENRNTNKENIKHALSLVSGGYFLCSIYFRKSWNFI